MSKPWLSIVHRARSSRRWSSLLLGVTALAPLLAAAPAQAELVSGIGPRFPDDMVPVTIQNVATGKCLDLPGGSLAFGQEIQQLGCHRAINQQFFLTLAQTNGPHAYQLRLALSGWRSLMIADNSVDDKAKLVISDPVKDGMIFQLDHDPFENTYAIVSRKSGKCLDVPAGNPADGVTIEQYACNGGTNQRWTITPITADAGYGMHLIAQHSEKCLDVAGFSYDAGAVVQQFDCLKQTNQRWRLGAPFIVKDTPYYPIIAEHSNQCLDVAGGSMANGAVIQQFPCHDGANQKWRPISFSDGYVMFENQQSRLCLDIESSSADNHVVLKQFPCTGTPNQRFFYGIVDTRHIQVVSVADRRGNGRIDQSDQAILDEVQRVNEIYGRYGIRLVYDPATDYTEVNSEAFYNLNSGNQGTYRCNDGRLIDGWTCAYDYGRSRWPDKVVVFSRPALGNGFTYGDFNFIAIDHMGGLNDFICDREPVPNVSFLAHEFGHYMGLNHTFEFDGDDLLGDTRGPDPVFEQCLAPRSPTGRVGDVVVDTNNVMSYYQNVRNRITPMQAYIVRANAYARGY